MRDLTAKMAELKFEAPLAKFEDGDDFISTQNTLNMNLKEAANTQDNKMRILEEAVVGVNKSKHGVDGNKLELAITPNCNTLLEMALDDLTNVLAVNNELNSSNNKPTITTGEDNFTETLGGSLEDLVNTFDERITKCFGNFEENVEELAPVQVRSQEEIINDCQMWWTITGNFGNILPIDWSKSFTRQMHMPTLHLGQKENGSVDKENNYDDFNDITSEDEAVANDLDMHALILNGLNNDNDEPTKTVEEVIKEIDDIMDEAESPENNYDNCESEVIEKTKEVLGAPLFADKLEFLSIAQLNELYMEMEVLIQELSETLISELALRDELDFEKELKNSFISLLLSVQNKRRQYHVEKKRGKFQGPEPKYLTTVIPYHPDNSTPNNQSLQVLIKVLKAINEDSPTVPTLLTDYILKILCPT